MLPETTPNIELEITEENYGQFVAQPLERGFGVTLGNALRRVLYGALPGAAVTAVKIEGVEHEFSTTPHVKEDTMEFLLNVKELRLRPLSKEPGKLTLEVAGEGCVSASDIKAPPEFEIVNPELHLATLDSPEAKLKVDFYVGHGLGYVPAGQSDGLPLPLGAIPVDAIFTPVRKVNYAVEKVRVGQVSNYDRLTLEVWTDGTLTALEAVNRSAQILMSYFSLFTEVGKVVPVAPGKQPFLPSVPPEKYDIPIEELGFSGRTLNSLKRAKIVKVGELLERSKEELSGIRGFGQKSLDEVLSTLTSLDLIPIAPAEEKELGVQETPEVQKGAEGEEVSLPASDAEIKEEANAQSIGDEEDRKI